METLSLPGCAQRPWARAVVVEDVGSRRGMSGQTHWLAQAPRIAAESFELRWRKILRVQESAWINIVPIAVEGDTLVVVVECREPSGRGPTAGADRDPGHALATASFPAGS
jgi:hypothetical protein